MSSLRIALEGSGEQAELWSAGLGPHAEICRAERARGADALIIAPGADKPFASAREALASGVAVLYAAPFALTPWQVARLREVSESGGTPLHFVEPFRCLEGFSFVERLLTGDEPFCRPSYLRMLRLARPEGGARLDELACEELALCQTLAGGTPSRVWAVASRTDRRGDASAAFLTLEYSDGLVVQSTVSVSEAACASELVAVTADHTFIVMDPSCVDAAAREDKNSSPVFRSLPPGHLSPSRRREVAESRGEGRPARSRGVTREVAAFVEALARNDVIVANAAIWEKAAAIWWAARQSMSFGAPVDVSDRPLAVADVATPPLRVIQGGGKTDRSGGRPALTLLAGS